MGMDAELKAYLDGMVETIVDRLGTRLTALEHRMEAVGRMLWSTG